MFFATKKMLQRAVKLLHFRMVREFSVVKSTKIHWRVGCKRADQGCEFKLTVCMSKKDNMWKIITYEEGHTCDMVACCEGHFNLDINMIASVLITDLEKMPKFPIKDCMTVVHKVYGKIISRRKTYLGWMCAFENIYGQWEASFSDLPRYMNVL